MLSKYKEAKYGHFNASKDIKSIDIFATFLLSELRHFEVFSCDSDLTTTIVSPSVSRLVSQQIVK